MYVISSGRIATAYVGALRRLRWTPLLLLLLSLAEIACNDDTYCWEDTLCTAFMRESPNVSRMDSTPQFTVSDNPLAIARILQVASVYALWSAARLELAAAQSSRRRSSRDSSALQRILGISGYIHAVHYACFEPINNLSWSLLATISLVLTLFSLTAIIW